jgi:hypothetical protein
VAEETGGKVATIADVERVIQILAALRANSFWRVDDQGDR